jgi:hypothetical protein
MSQSYVAAARASAFLLFVVAVAPTSGAEPDAVDYSRDVRPILADNCFHCHGQDPSHREAGLRLDVLTVDGDDESVGSEAVIAPGSPDESELVARITSDDPDLRMPPAAAGKSLKPEQIEILQRWIAQGAKYQQHWAFEAPVRPTVPAVAGADAGWVRNPIDAFVIARLRGENLPPSPRANANTLLRRLSLDLVGLPPTLDELEAYEAEAAIDGESAYAHAVERLLATPRFGERWARQWLDAARYADSDGFEKDKPRFVWMYRDWVIDALNANMPYDQFIVEQIAGDLLPGATQDQVVATGFLRNSMINEEGGVDPEQFRMEAMFDRMDAIGKSMLGLTVQCAQCHTHKYDPIEQTDYYRMFAFLNNCDEGQIAAYTDEERAQWDATRQVIDRIERDLRDENPNWPERMAAWEQSVRDATQTAWEVVRPQLDSSGGQKHYLLADGSVLAAGYAPTKHTTEFTVEVTAPKVTAVRLELLNDPNLPCGGPGRSIYGTCALSEFHVTAAPLNGAGKPEELKIAGATADVNPPRRPLESIFDDRGAEKRFTGPIEYAVDRNNASAWTSDAGPGRANVPHNAVFMLEKPVDAGSGVRLTFRLAQNHGGWNSDDNQNYNLGRFRFSVTGDEKATADVVPRAVRDVLAVPPADRTPEQAATVFSYWRTTVPEWTEENRRLEALWQSHPHGTTQLVLHQRQPLRTTHRLDRGDFLKPQEPVAPGVPGFLHPLELAAGEQPTRLDFARWLADRRSPTTARSIVNRLWQAYFGTGLVATAEDFGTQGEYPTHPELLDWLAVELMDNGWQLKPIHRLIVSSATYQQTAAATPELLERDPANRLLARGARFRVDGEMVRDIALATSGLLTDKIGGPSVYPPAPEFLFQPPTSYGPKTWRYDLGPDKYRRAMYTFRFRSVPYPALENFDAPKGDVSCVRRMRSNTPLQALTTLNEDLSMEAARALAVRIAADGGADDGQRLRYAVRRCLAREPEADELRMLGDFLASQRTRFSGEDDPWPLIGGGNDATAKPELPDGVSAPELAAWTALARVVLNLDETITRE